VGRFMKIREVGKIIGMRLQVLTAVYIKIMVF
jgi:hypothetical protein